MQQFKIHDSLNMYDIFAPPFCKYSLILKIKVRNINLGFEQIDRFSSCTCLSDNHYNRFTKERLQSNVPLSVDLGLPQLLFEPYTTPTTHEATIVHYVFQGLCGFTYKGENIDDIDCIIYVT